MQAELAKIRKSPLRHETQCEVLDPAPTFQRTSGLHLARLAAIITSSFRSLLVSRPRGGSQATTTKDNPAAQDIPLQQLSHGRDRANAQGGGKHVRRDHNVSMAAVAR
jgi:hypothetical protein